MPLRSILACCLLTVCCSDAFGYSLPAAPATDSVDENLQTLQRISRGVATIAKKANQAVVFVSVYKNNQGNPYGTIDPFDFFFGPGRKHAPGEEPKTPQKRDGGLGSGFFVDLNKGYILTNNHVVQDADEIQLKLANGSVYEGKVVGRDRNTDVAVVKVKIETFNKTGLADLALGNSDGMEVGDFVVALGAPFGLEASLSFGVVSALGRGNLDITTLGNFIQTDAAINPGNSGGPLLDMHGQVVGINTAIYSRSGGYNGIGFAVPASLVRSVAEQLIDSGRISRGYLGVALQPIDDELHTSLALPDRVKGGALVSQVAKDGPANRAGIEPGDVIAEINDQPTRAASEVTNLIGLSRPGAKVGLTVYRDGKPKKLKVTIGEHPDDKEKGGPERDHEPDSPAGKSQPFGLGIANWSKAAQDRYGFESQVGVVVNAVEPDSAADRAGLRPGDVILTVDGKKVTSVAAFAAASQGKKRMLIWFERSHRFNFVPLRAN